MLFGSHVSVAAKDVKAIRTQYLMRAVLSLDAIASDVTAANAHLLKRAEELRQYFSWVEGELVPERKGMLRERLDKLLSDLSRHYGRALMSSEPSPASGTGIYASWREISSQDDPLGPGPSN